MGHILNIHRLICHNRNLLQIKRDLLITECLKHIKNCDNSYFESLRNKNVVLKDALNPLTSFISGTDTHKTDKEKAKEARNLSYSVRDSIIGFNKLQEMKYVSKSEFIMAVDENKRSAYWIPRSMSISILGAAITSSMALFSTDKNKEAGKDFMTQSFNIASQISEDFVKSCVPLLGSLLSIAAHEIVDAITDSELYKQQTTHKFMYDEFQKLVPEGLVGEACSFFKDKDKYIKNFEEANKLIMTYEKECADNFDSYLSKIKYYLNAYMIICKEPFTEEIEEDEAIEPAVDGPTLEKIVKLLNKANDITENPVKISYNELTESDKNKLLQNVIERDINVPTKLTEKNRISFFSNMATLIADITKDKREPEELNKKIEDIRSKAREAFKIFSDIKMQKRASNIKDDLDKVLRANKEKEFFEKLLKKNPNYVEDTDIDKFVNDVYEIIQELFPKHESL